VVRRVTLFTKANCPLCDQALEQIELARQQANFQLLEVNILSDPTLYERYKDSIPVVLLNERELFRFRLTAAALLQQLN
jgi:glutaredoxin